MDIKVLTFVKGVLQDGVDMQIPVDVHGEFSDEPTFVTGIDQVTQDTVKGMLTLYGSDYLAPNYGTNINKYLHARKLNDVATQLSSEIQTVLGYIAQYNANQDPSEQLVELIDLQAEEGIDSITIKTTIRTGTGAVTTITT